MFSVPNGLWAFSFLFFFLWIWRGELRSPQAIIWLALIIFVVEGSEFAQKFHIIPGTYDVGDITWNTFGLSLAILLSWRRRFWNAEEV